MATPIDLTEGHTKGRWCGELVQLMAVDAYTFWRNISILTALVALTMNRAEGGQRCFQ
jgi:hypothetical protein